MNTAQRRESILSHLKSHSTPVSAARLAGLLGVSRQIIVSDVALLRAGGADISATPRGYVLTGDGEPVSGHPFEGILACKHTDEQLQEELYTIVDFGGEVLDVTIEHALYGQLSGPLQLTSRYEVDLFLEKSQLQGDLPLSSLTEGVHLHRVGCRDEATFLRIKKALEEKHLLLH
ncbi:transcription repressor NadR [Aminipila butyrica]|uniref:Transcription repressor NadR n=1 Tax=Aminipila butyrica TaxID=433296 RepID=A0A858BRD1_9FIRM|nr:transcription repressor NadR [Aminipila butyrica]QIB68471.1 transcription repressor NadR [Aminipila butyrica]